MRSVAEARIESLISHGPDLLSRLLKKIADPESGSDVMRLLEEYKYDHFVNLKYIITLASSRLHATYPTKLNLSWKNHTPLYFEGDDVAGGPNVAWVIAQKDKVEVW